jgi:hypothetical protein
MANVLFPKDHATLADFMQRHAPQGQDEAMPVDAVVENTAVMVLDRALEVLGPNGEHWTQGKFDDGAGSYCMVGAIMFAQTQLRVEDNDAMYLMVEVFSASEFMREYGVAAQHSMLIADFNDTPGRQFAHIRQVLQRARDIAFVGA